MVFIKLIVLYPPRIGVTSRFSLPHRERSFCSDIGNYPARERIKCCGLLYLCSPSKCLCGVFAYSSWFLSCNMVVYSLSSVVPELFAFHVCLQSHSLPLQSAWVFVFVVVVLPYPRSEFPYSL